MNMKMNMEPIWSILKMIGYFLMELLVWIGTVLLHVTTFLLLFFVLRKVKNKPKIKKYHYCPVKAGKSVFEIVET